MNRHLVFAPYNHSRFGNKAEGIQESKEGRIAKIGPCLHGRHAHVQNRKHERIHATYHGLDTNRRNAELKKEGRDAVRKILENDVNAAAHGGNPLPNRIHGIRNVIENVCKEVLNLRKGAGNVGRMTHKQIFHTKLEVFGSIVAVEGGEWHDGWLTSMVGPIIFDLFDAGGPLANCVFGKHCKCNQDQNAKRIHWIPCPCSIGQGVLVHSLPCVCVKNEYPIHIPVCFTETDRNRTQSVIYCALFIRSRTQSRSIVKIARASGATRFDSFATASSLW